MLFKRRCLWMNSSSECKLPIFDMNGSTVCYHQSLGILDSLLIQKFYLFKWVCDLYCHTLRIKLVTAQRHELSVNVCHCLSCPDLDCSQELSVPLLLPRNRSFMGKLQLRLCSSLFVFFRKYSAI